MNYYTTKQAADLMNCHDSTAARKLRQAGIDPVNVGRAHAWPVDKVDAFIASYQPPARVVNPDFTGGAHSKAEATRNRQLAIIRKVHREVYG